MNIHMNIRFPLVLATLMLALVALTACGGRAPAPLGAIPTYPGATELKPGENPVADTLVKNMQQSQAMSTQLGVNATVEQKGFRLPQDTSWDAIKKFYDGTLTGSGWSNNSMVGNALAAASQNGGVQIANWQRDTQNISVIMMVDPTNPNAKMLLLSLASS